MKKRNLLIIYLFFILVTISSSFLFLLKEKKGFDINDSGNGGFYKIEKVIGKKKLNFRKFY